MKYTTIKTTTAKTDVPHFPSWRDIQRQQLQRILSSQPKTGIVRCGGYPPFRDLPFFLLKFLFCLARRFFLGFGWQVPFYK